MVAERADCLILLDINNICVSAFNHNHDPFTYLEAMPADRVWQMHLAGHTREDDLIIDTHDHPIADPVFELYAAAVERFGPVSTMIERDDNIPPLPELLDELEQVRRIAEQPTPVTAAEGEPVPWLVWREQLATGFRSLQPDQQAALDCLRDGGDFGEACARLTVFVDAAAVPRPCSRAG